MKLSFLDFWQYPVSFQPNNNFLYYLLLECFEDVELVDPEDAELIIFSCFGNDHTRFNHCKKVFYTGENIRPSSKKSNYSLSFDYDDYGGKNIRLPLWMMYIDWFKKGTYGNPEYLIPESYLYGENEFSIKPKHKFCSIVFSALYELRSKAVAKLSEYKSVDVYGKYGLPLQYGEKNKLNVVSDYKFSLCFENAIYPGYFTEKLLHAKVSGTIPIYYSDLAFVGDFNSKCCLNVHEIGLDSLYEKVIEIDNDENLYNQILNQPLFNEKISLDPFIKQITKTVIV
jgi:hypothetical protein